MSTFKLYTRESHFIANVKYRHCASFDISYPPPVARAHYMYVMIHTYLTIYK